MNVGVLGGGIQGCCVALLFNKLGYNVTIIDKASDIMTRASVNQEGKIHMGFVYCNDETFETGKKMMLDALHFSYYMEYLLDEKVDWNSMKSTKFLYLVPDDSLVQMDKMNEYFTKLQQVYTDILKENPHLSYLGERPEKIVIQRSVPDNVDQSFFRYCYETEEIAISQPMLKKYIRNALVKKGVKFIFNENAIKIDDKIYKFNVHTNRNVYQFDKVVNCAWESQNILDKTVHLMARDNDNLRLKFGIVSEQIEELKSMPSATIVNGPYGDFVNFKCPEDTKMYFSWYPVAMYGMIVNKELPEEWENICNNQYNQELKDYQLIKQLESFQQLFLKKFNFKEPKLIGGIIVARGKDDIDHKDSELHKRSDLPITIKGNYYSISTGKFTSGPRNTLQLEEYLCQKDIMLLNSS